MVDFVSNEGNMNRAQQERITGTLAVTNQKKSSPRTGTGQLLDSSLAFERLAEQVCGIGQRF
jgi:hypothetical protein